MQQLLLVSQQAVERLLFVRIRMLVATELRFRFPNAKSGYPFVAEQTLHGDEYALRHADPDARRGFTPNMHCGAMPAG